MSTPSLNRIRQILEDLESSRQDLLDLAGEIWEAIDPTDEDDLEAGCEFMKAFNDKVQKLDETSESIGDLVEDYLDIELKEQSETAGRAPDGDAQYERAIETLDEEEPHSLDEDFTYRRPYGFMLLENGHVDVGTWTFLYQMVCLQLAERDPEQFAQLPETEQFHTSRGNQYFATDPDVLRAPRLITDTVYAETHFSANDISDRIADLLGKFELSADDITIYLREDRDA
jgi:hypothetical protein